MQAKEVTEAYMGVSHAAMLIGCSRQRVHALIEQGRIDGQKISGVFLLKREQVLGYVNGGRKKVGRPSK
jgi:excisionase family DNA binding protein